MYYSKLDHFEYSRRTTSPVDEHLMTPYMQANSTSKEERQKILQSREKKKGKKRTEGKPDSRRQNNFCFPHSRLNRDDNLTGYSDTGWRGRSLFVGPSKSSREK